MKTSIICVLLAVIGPASLQASCAQKVDSGATRITESEAIRLGEEFIARNGYTEVPPSDDGEIVYELTDPRNRDLALTERSNTLEPRAYSVWPREEPEGWIVVFRYNANNDVLQSHMPDFREHVEVFGRAVTMNLRGFQIKLEHQDIGLRRTTKR